MNSKSIANTSLLSGREHSEVADKDGEIRLDDLFKLEPKNTQTARVRGGAYDNERLSRVGEEEHFEVRPQRQWNLGKERVGKDDHQTERC